MDELNECCAVVTLFQIQNKKVKIVKQFALQLNRKAKKKMRTHTQLMTFCMHWQFVDVPICTFTTLLLICAVLFFFFILTVSTYCIKFYYFDFIFYFHSQPMISIQLATQFNLSFMNK